MPMVCKDQSLKQLFIKHTINYDSLFNPHQKILVTAISALKGDDAEQLAICAMNLYAKITSQNKMCAVIVSHNYFFLLFLTLF